MKGRKEERRIKSRKEDRKKGGRVERKDGRKGRRRKGWEEVKKEDKYFN